jgi:hypothetical protein
MPDPTPPIIQAAEQYRAALLAKDAQAMNRLISAYQRIYGKLKDKIDLLVMEIEKAGGTLAPGQVARMERYTQLITQAAEELRDYQAITKAEIEAVSRFGISQGVTDARNLMSVAATGTPQIAGAFNVLPKGAIEQLLGFLSPDGPLYARLSLLAPTTVEGVSKAILDGVAMGSNPRIIAREITNAFGMGLTDSMRMTRTVQLWSYRESNRATYVANQDIIEGWVWHADLSPRTCMSCLANHGKVFPLDARLNDHHQGRCSPIPLLNGQENPVEAGTAEKWFDSQGKATQRQMMGKGKYEAWKGGKFGFSQLTTDSKPDRVYGVMKVETPLKDLLNGKKTVEPTVPQINVNFTEVKDALYTANGYYNASEQTKGILADAVNKLPDEIKSLWSGGNANIVLAEANGYVGTHQSNWIIIGREWSGEAKQDILKHEFIHHIVGQKGISDQLGAYKPSVLFEHARENAWGQITQKNEDLTMVLTGYSKSRPDWIKALRQEENLPDDVLDKKIETALGFLRGLGLWR